MENMWMLYWQNMVLQEWDMQTTTWRVQYSAPTQRPAWQQEGTFAKKSNANPNHLRDTKQGNDNLKSRMPKKAPYKTSTEMLWGKNELIKEGNRLVSCLMFCWDLMNVRRKGWETLPLNLHVYSVTNTKPRICNSLKILVLSVAAEPSCKCSCCQSFLAPFAMPDKHTAYWLGASPHYLPFESMRQARAPESSSYINSQAFTPGTIKCICSRCQHDSDR